MRALQQTTSQGPKDLHLIADAPVPLPGPGEVLIRVAAAGVNFADVSKAYGTFGDGPMPPFVAGFEAAGEVVALGAGVDELLRGRVVVGVGAGAFAEYMLIPAAAALPLPSGWTAAQGLGLVVNWPTALAALGPLGRLAAGETVLISAAAGATGQAALAMTFAPRCFASFSAAPSKHEKVQALGADHVLDSSSELLAAEVLALTRGEGADLVLESGGGAALAQSLAATRRVTGRVIVYGLAGGEASVSNWELVYRHQIQLIGFNLGTFIRAAPRLFGEVMRELFALMAAGVVTPAEPTSYGLAEGARALAELESRATTGKLCLVL
jgi:NADPH:quinone reductase